MRHVPIIVLLTFALVTPSALAVWGSRGSYEPDTVLDVTKGFNHFEPDQANDGKSRVYFNAWQAPFIGQSSGLNPNSATLRTGFRSDTAQASALLGVWKDCNKDGFVGLGDQGLFEYRATLLTVPNQNGVTPGTSVCPPATIPSPIPRDWKPIHNDGDWVHEFLPIGWDVNGDCLTCKDQNPWNIRDDAARVWGDEGIPAPIAGNGGAGSACYLNSHPRGTFDNVGNMITTMDCYTGGFVDFAGRAASRNATGSEGAWESVRAIENPWGHEEDESAVTGFDCTNPVVAPRNVAGDAWIGVPRPGSVAPNGGGSIGGTFNETETQFGDCVKDDRDSTTVKNLPYSTEGDVANDDTTGVTGKDQSNYPMVYNEGCRGVNPVPLVPTCNLAALGRGSPSAFDGYIGLRWGTEGMWSQGSVTSGGAFGFPSHITMYASVSPAAVTKYTLTLPKGTTTEQYGSEACVNGIGTGQPMLNGWECDGAEWWPTGSWENVAAATIGGKFTFVGAKVGQSYNFRDTDCYDWTVGPARDEDIAYGTLVPPLVPDTPVTDPGTSNPCA